MTTRLSRERALQARRALDHLHTPDTELARFASKVTHGSRAAHAEVSPRPRAARLRRAATGTPSTAREPAAAHDASASSRRRRAQRGARCACSPGSAASP